jgi:hypothetical protein
MNNTKTKQMYITSIVQTGWATSYETLATALPVEICFKVLVNCFEGLQL